MKKKTGKRGSAVPIRKARRIRRPERKPAPPPAPEKENEIGSQVPIHEEQIDSDDQESTAL